MLFRSIANALGIATYEEMEYLKEAALKINSVLVPYFDKNGYLLPDFKLEFGRCNGEIILADEISCDTCRIWDKVTKESFDKDIFRYEKGDLTKAYEIVARKLVPEIFE